MSDKPSSERQQIAQRIAQFILDNDLANPFGGDVDQTTGKGRPYSVLMSVPRYLDGQVLVYGPKFILINMDGPLARHGTGFVYESEQHALDFLRLMLVEHDSEKALAIPTKAAK